VNSAVAAVLPASSPALERQVGNLPHGPAAISPVAIDGVFTSHRLDFGPAVAGHDNAQPAGAWAWLAASDGFSDQNKKNGAKIAALDSVLAQYEV
jgi:hypothetical protein